MSKVLITGAAGFIGSHLSEALLKKGFSVVGIDNFDPFYNRSIKERNLKITRSNENFTFIEMDISKKSDFSLLDLHNDIETVVHLAAKAGVRPSIEDPTGYLKANIIGTQNVLEWMNSLAIKNLLFASSSSVYGNNKKVPFSETDNVDYPISPYAYTKKAGELLIHTFHHLYKINALCLRFFTVYGPRQRPDLAIHKFNKLIDNDQPIEMYGDGNTSRDYTFIEDTINGIIGALEYVNHTDSPIYDIVNLGSTNPITLKEMIQLIIEISGKEVKVNMLPMQPGDVNQTYADINKAKALFGYEPKVSFKEGLIKFYNWKNEQ